jgi:hypothetical protein
VLLGAFLRLTPYIADSSMSDDQVFAGVEKALRKYFGKQGDRVVADNLTCVKRGYSEMKEVPPEIMISDLFDLDEVKRAMAEGGKDALPLSEVWKKIKATEKP